MYLSVSNQNVIWNILDVFWGLLCCDICSLSFNNEMSDIRLIFSIIIINNLDGHLRTFKKIV